jgi:hypothetical protein
MKLEFSQHIFEHSSNIKFNQNPSSDSRVVARDRTDGQTDMTKLIVAFCNIANAPNKTKLRSRRYEIMPSNQYVTHTLYLLLLRGICRPVRWQLPF